ncbi:MFS transporter, PHS family, inorganic phosphate transporter [Teratosphaeria destructans]|uniref:MFS transporter, PHS family, inorganic phosphate transporter n=1 Tax=Teratosphaeria destructans TaxID=418781 RepID=A0A9W7SM97_9PEZI|nr:MFS transporter, PHS family, inorganic phosphate transporter [Teratosphaeria destructans]
MALIPEDSLSSRLDEVEAFKQSPPGRLLEANPSFVTIGLVVQILGALYYQDNHGHVPTVEADLIKGALHLGMITGQILFGVFGD